MVAGFACGTAKAWRKHLDRAGAGHGPPPVPARPVRRMGSAPEVNDLYKQLYVVDMFAVCSSRGLTRHERDRITPAREPPDQMNVSLRV